MLRAAPLQLDLAVLDGALEVRIAHDFLDHLIDVECLALERRVGAVQSRELQHLADQPVETLDFPLQSIELAREVGRRLARQARRATRIRASGERSSCEMSRSSCVMALRLARSWSAMASKSRASTASSSLRPSRPALTRTFKIFGGERARALLDAADGSAQMLRQPPTREGAHHQCDAENRQGDSGQAQGAENARAARHQQHRVGRAIRPDDLRRGALRTKIARRAPVGGSLAVEELQSAAPRPR